ncbi:MAG: NMCC_0638 family (lipo)protein, partial [Pseudomonas fluorescens]
MRSLLLLMATSAAPAFAAESALPDDFNALFASTCMQYYYSQDTLRDQLERQGLEILPPDQAEFFLSGNEGTAWLFVAPSTRYVVSLSNDSTCSVFAQRGDPEQIQAGFLGLVGTAPPPLVAQVPDTARLGPNNDRTKTVARSWARPTDNE